jgi:integrase
MQNTSHAVMAQRTESLDSPDDFPTPPWATRGLIEHRQAARPRAGDEAKIGFKVHPPMLRHACGYALANRGVDIDTRTLQAYLGHRSINSTTRYAALGSGPVQKYLG